MTTIDEVLTSLMHAKVQIEEFKAGIEVLDSFFPAQTKHAEDTINDYLNEGNTNEKGTLDLTKKLLLEARLAIHLYFSPYMVGQAAERNPHLSPTDKQLQRLNEIVKETEQLGCARDKTTTMYEALSLAIKDKSMDKWTIMHNIMEDWLQAYQQAVQNLNLKAKTQPTMSKLLYALATARMQARNAVADPQNAIAQYKEAKYAITAIKIRPPADIKLPTRKITQLTTLMHLYNEIALASQFLATKDKSVLEALKEHARQVQTSNPEHDNARLYGNPTPENIQLALVGAATEFNKTYNAFDTGLTHRMVTHALSGIAGLLKTVLKNQSYLERLAANDPEKDRLSYLQAAMVSQELTPEQQQIVQCMALMTEETYNLSKVMKGARNVDIDDDMLDNLSLVQRQIKLGANRQQSYKSYQAYEQQTAIATGMRTETDIRKETEKFGAILKELTGAYEAKMQEFMETLPTEIRK